MWLPHRYIQILISAQVLENSDFNCTDSKIFGCSFQRLSDVHNLAVAPADRGNLYFSSVVLPSIPLHRSSHSFSRFDV